MEGRTSWERNTSSVVGFQRGQSWNLGTGSVVQLLLDKKITWPNLQPSLCSLYWFIRSTNLLACFCCEESNDLVIWFKIQLTCLTTPLLSLAFQVMKYLLFVTCCSCAYHSPASYSFAILLHASITGITANIWMQKGICLEGFRVGSKASHRPAFLIWENCPGKETVVALELVKTNRLGKQGMQIGSKPIWKPGRSAAEEVIEL